MRAEPTENDVRAAAAVGKKLVVLTEDVDGYELCVPEDGFRPRDSFWRKRTKEMQEPVSALVAVVRMSGPMPVPKHESPEPEPVPEPVALVPEPESVAKVAREEAKAIVPAPEPSSTRIMEPGPIKLRLLPKKVDVEDIRPVLGREDDGLEHGEKICVDCELPYPLEAFYKCVSAKDGRQSRCTECDNKRRAEHNQGLHVKASEKDSYEQKIARKRASEAALAAGRKAPSYAYKGVTGGFLIYGYVR